MYVHTKTFTVFWNAMKIFVTVFNVTNGKPCCRVNPIRPLIPLVTPFLWCTDILYYMGKSPFLLLDKMLTGRYILQFLIFFCRIDLNHSLVCSTCHYAFSEKSLNFKFVQILGSWCFSYGNNENQTRNPLIPSQKSHCFGSTNMASEFESHH